LRKAEAKGEHPERETWIFGVVGASQRFEFLKCCQQAPELFLHLADMGGSNARCGIAAKEELEQELVAGRIVAVRNGEPLLKACMAGRGDGVLLAVGPG